jgi:hypothetical protein
MYCRHCQVQIVQEKVLEPEDEGSVILGKVRNYWLPNNTASHPGRHEVSAALL